MMMRWWWYKYDSVYFAVVDDGGIIMMVIYDTNVFGEMREQERKVLGFWKWETDQRTQSAQKGINGISETN